VGVSVPLHAISSSKKVVLDIVERIIGNTFTLNHCKTKVSYQFDKIDVAETESTTSLK
jgi:uncharacterized protein YkuJ